MSKQISTINLAHILCRLLLNQNKEFDTNEQAMAFQIALTQLVADHCGGTVIGHDEVEGQTYIGIVADASSPEDGGIWQAYDLEGDLQNRDDFVPGEHEESALRKLDTFVICRNGAQDVGRCIDTVWQVDFTNHTAIDYDDYMNCPEWRYLMKHASFTHTEVADLILHVDCLIGETKAPATIRKLALQAEKMGMTWILFHLGQ